MIFEMINIIDRKLTDAKTMTSPHWFIERVVMENENKFIMYRKFI